ncbi:hypothetical protein J5N97_010621 [Dioscorea zingiberensis]|uniref:Uncharacterized protein n=1 Tax=Dioscorea zingiberensis TaxID=325984 RepID=A0A9D5HMY6_9LILI|nr:hypothetical protein J5N97_010621 [Dioscorea zingiberensis]
MSRRGGGRGGGGRSGGGRSGGGRGDEEYPPLRQQPGGVQSQPRGGGRGGGRGRGFTGGSGGAGAGPDRPSFQPAASAPAAPPRHAPQADLPASSAQEALSLETEKKLVIGEPSGSPPPVDLIPVSTKGMKHPPRPGFGTAGRKCVVRANHFLVQVSNKDLHHYDVAINPEITLRRVNREVISRLVKLYGESHLGRRMPVYDGRKSLYTAGALPFTSKDFVVKLTDSDDKGKIKKEREFKVTIKLVGKPDLYLLQEFLRGRNSDVPQDTIQVLDVALRESPSVNYVTVARSFFSSSLGQKFDLGGGLESWKGYYQSLRPTQMGLSLNIDISSTSFYKAVPVVDFVGECLQIHDISRPLSESDRVKIKKALRGLKVDTTHTPRRYKITGISPVPMNQLKFTNENGTTISVIQYFREKYNCTLRYGTLPCLQAGVDTRPTYLPMEVCKIAEGQRYMKKLNEQQVRSLLKSTCQRPAAREQSILEMVNYNNYSNDNYAKEFGIQVMNQLVSVDARVLPPPRLRYHESGRDKVVNPEVGQWNMINKKMVNGGIVENWTCVNFSRLREDAIYQFCYDMVQMCNNIGMMFTANPLITIRSARSDRIDATLNDIHLQSTEAIVRNKGRGKQLQLLIVVLPDINGFYGKIKRICETELGIVSQCCSPRHVSRCNKQYLENVAQKINVKVGGRNNVLEDAINRNIPLVTDLPTIIFGADVTHPSPGEDASPSIAAVVASMDWPEVTKYRALVSAQEHRQEMIKDLFTESQNPDGVTIFGGMIREHLRAFRRATNQIPHRIIFYRDGVSEGQFSHVLLYEMDAIRKACASLQDGYLPPVTFVVVQKRHHTRLFPQVHGKRELTDRSGNILPGTVIDSKICHPTEFDFYLCSHSGIQGTSRPTHYHVLLDENKFSANALQTLTNNLCYTYARCTRSVSVVPPAYYAHLAAFRARYYIEGESSDGGSSSVRGGGVTRQGGSAFRPLPMIMDNVKDVMFYC